MSRNIHLRIAGSTAIISLHLTNISYMDWYTTQVYTEDPRVLMFKHLGKRFFTTWTIMLQIAYFSFSLFCDIMILKNSQRRSYTLPRNIDKIRDVVFSAIVWPSTWIVFTVFWGLYIYDRSLIFPQHLDIALPTVSNHVIHTLIIPIVLFEVIARPRVTPKPHWINLGLLTLYMGIYLIVLLYTYYERNIWLYPIFEQLYGSVYFLLVLAVIYGTLVLFYHAQWPIGIYIHGEPPYQSSKKMTRGILTRR